MFVKVRHSVHSLLRIPVWQSAQPINDNLEATGLAIFKEKFSSPNDGFNEIPLYDLAEYINGTSFSEDEYSSDGLPIIKIAELKDGITSATQYFVGNKDPKYLIHDSDVLFSWSGNPDTSIDAFIWSHGDGILNQHTFRMVPRNGVAFTYFMLKFCKPEFVKAAMGKQTTGLGHVTIADLKRMSLMVPSKEVQNQIVSILKAIDDKIEVNTSINENLLQQAEALFKERFLTSDTIPIDWKRMALGDVSDMSAGGDKPQKHLGSENG